MRRFAIILMTMAGGSSIAFGQGGAGWQANPEWIRHWEEQRSDYIWREEAVPEFELPDPLAIAGGGRVESVAEWRERRNELLELFREQMYGKRPGPPHELSFETIEEDATAMDGAATLRRIAIRSRQGARSHAFELVLFLPNRSASSAPVFLLMNNRGAENTDPSRESQSGFWPAEAVIERGYGVAAIQNGDLAPDEAERYHEGVIRLFEGEAASEPRPGDQWKALAAWGWGASRAMDYFETDARVDSERVALLGHSRGGKAALWAGAEDERFALVISNESGAGGAALSRRRFGETLRAVNRFSHWFAGNFTAYNDAEATLPFDQHQLIALMAPRPVYVASADEDLWADPRGEFLALSHASPVYALWGYEPIGAEAMPALDQALIVGPRAYHVRRGGHNLTPWDWQRFMDFADTLGWGAAR